ncbi:AI-2E family transporter [Spirochaetia bacterium]|nr:AI-2E family transporter [Spirochaetia bacterium]GHU36019.1 AI-2E family transporter [Spirochaetia bacterium]
MSRKKKIKPVSAPIPEKTSVPEKSSIPEKAENKTHGLDRNVQNFVFGIILVGLLIIVCQIIAPFFTMLLWSALFYVLFNPLHRRVVAKIDTTKRLGVILKNMWAAIFAVFTAVIILIPLLFVVSQLFKQLVDLLRLTSETFSARPQIIQELLDNLSQFIEDISLGQIIISPDEIWRNIVTLLRTGLQQVVQISSTVAKNVGRFAFSLVLMVFCLFFFYVDGAYLSRLFLHAIPIRSEYLSTLVEKFKDSVRNLFLGYIVVALVQGIIAFIIFSIFQVKGALVFAALTFICVFIPMIGGSIIWIPLGIVRIVSGDIYGGIIFMVVSGLCISTLDNFLRPFFLQNRIQLHPLIIFLSILGGITVFGFNGLIIGPLVVIFFLTVLDLFLAEHETLLP